MKVNEDFARKVVCFTTAIANVYKEEDKRAYIPELELDAKEVTEDFTAMLVALHTIYEELTGNEDDIIGFTHILNRLAVQWIVNKEEEKSDDKMP